MGAIQRGAHQIQTPCPCACDAMTICTEIRPHGPQSMALITAFWQPSSALSLIYATSSNGDFPADPLAHLTRHQIKPWRFGCKESLALCNGIEPPHRLHSSDRLAPEDKHHNCNYHLPAFVDVSQILARYRALS